jgi:hypothetical protein
MNTRAKIMGLAALPLAGLLATGGAALAQTAGTPASTQVVQQAAVHKAGNPCPEHAVKTAAQQAAKPCPQHAVKTVAQQVRDRDRDGNCDHPAQAARATAVTTAHSHHDGNCAGHGDR